ncbi:VacJ family lipoprotein [Neptunicella sp. SCSIO 80796]|uniref:MlaA family lipoprotein n=1 Tax=Neptunicella plasticusilytica TaxID=3117012 RepID=UPI003A4E3814
MKKLYTVLVVVLLLGGCANRQSVEQQADVNQTQQYADQRDPFESYNRDMWSFNWDVLDKNILRPVSLSYAENMPSFARKGLYHFALNLEEPANVINNLLQGKVADSFISLGRFLLNSTFGLLGTLDVATDAGIERRDESFAETLGVWGIGSGPFIMLPALGPSDARDSTGKVVEGVYYPFDLTLYLSLTTNVIKALEKRASFVDQEQLLRDAVDPYALIKNVYFQDQQFKILDGKIETSQEEQDLNEDIDAYLDNL